MTIRGTVVLLLGAALLAGCAAPPSTVTLPFSVEDRTARDGQLRYRVPAGWADVTADSASAGHVVWLLRRDLRATLTVDPVHVDADARDALAGGALLELARLQIALTSGARSVSVTRPPALQSYEDRQVCVYEFTLAPSGEAVRTVLVDAHARVYAVQALRNAGTTMDDLEAVQEGFVRLLRW
jgi:hypothetical protein